MPQKKRKAQKPKKKKPQKKDGDEKKVDSEDLCVTEEVKLDDEGLEIDPATSFPKNFKFSHLVSRNNTEGKGFGLVAKKHILEGEIIFQEFPLFTQQLLSNEKEGAACCAFCLRALGTPLDSLNGYVPDNVLSRIRLLPYQNQIYSVPVAEYCKKCLAIYCSANCRQLDAQRGHGLMCFTEEETEDNSFGKLRNACLTMENHLPILFGRMLSLCIHRAKESHLGVGSENGEDGASLEELVSKEWDKYFSGFCYHEETVSDEILNIYKQMVEYLRDIFQDYLQPDSKFLQVQFFKDTLDMLNVNQQLIVPRSPFDQYWNALSPEQENAPRAQKILGTVLEYLEKNQIIQVEYGRGSGILPVHHNLNHSCEPNAKVATINVDATLSVFALRDISEGEEICFDYVDTDNLSFTERQEKLLKCFYFHCLCPKCKREDSNSISNE